MQRNFGVGLLTLIPSGANPTPVQLGILQDVSLDDSHTEKELYGQYQYPVDVARAEAKLSGKAKFAQIAGSIFGAFSPGSVTTAGYTASAFNEAATIPTTPYQVTVSHSATFTTDCGVLDLNTGLFLARVASSPATGQYAVTAGVYTFAAADTGHKLWISYLYTVPTVGKSVLVTNELMGAGDVFQLNLFNTYKSQVVGITLYAVTLPKLSLAFKNNDFTLSDLDFGAYADSNGQVMSEFTSEV